MRADRPTPAAAVKSYLHELPRAKAGHSRELIRIEARILGAEVEVCLNSLDHSTEALMASWAHRALRSDGDLAVRREAVTIRHKNTISSLTAVGGLFDAFAEELLLGHGIDPLVAVVGAQGISKAYMTAIGSSRKRAEQLKGESGIYLSKLDVKAVSAHLATDLEVALGPLLAELEESSVLRLDRRRLNG